MELGIELKREISPATYVWEHREELPGVLEPDVVPAAIRAGMALEQWRFLEARRSWREVVAAARRAGSAARREGRTPRRLIAEVDRVRDAVEMVLFDGRLPADVAALAARRVSKMCTRAVEHALTSYWEAARGSGPVC